jgi:hypothetical protein
MPRLSEPFDASLSDDAKALAGGVFSWCPRLEFLTPSRITPRAKVALDELLRAEVIVQEAMEPSGVRYRPRIPLGRYRRWCDRHPAAMQFSLVDGDCKGTIDVLVPAAGSPDGR